MLKSARLVAEIILVPIALYSSLIRRGLGTRIEGRHGIPVLESRTSGLHVCSRDVSIYSGTTI